MDVTGSDWLVNSAAHAREQNLGSDRPTISAESLYGKACNDFKSLALWFLGYPVYIYIYGTVPR